MSASQSPIACTLAWLTVVAFLFSGAPARPSQLKLQLDSQSALDTGTLASGFVTADMADQKPLTSPELVKVWDLLGFLNSVHPELPKFTPSKILKPRGLALAKILSPCMVGTVELRI